MFVIPKYIVTIILDMVMNGMDEVLQLLCGMSLCKISPSIVIIANYNLLDN